MKRVIRIAIVAVLLAGAAVGAERLQDVERRDAALAAADAELAARVARVADALAGIRSAQQSYVAPGQSEGAWFAQVSTLLRQFYDETAALPPLLRSADAAPALAAMAGDIEAVIAADTQARENLRAGENLMAADLIFSDARATLDAMITELRTLQLAEHAAYEDARAGLAGERWTALGTVGALWLVGVIVLALLPGRPAPAVAASEPVPLPVPEPVAPPAVDLTAAADLCVALSKAASAAVLPDLLRRAAGVLDAPGIIVWMGAGEELFAVTAQGYKPQVLARLGPIPRGAGNATAAAWREGRLTAVPAGDGPLGALVAPMFGPHSCIGVLAIELPPGRETEPQVQAVASILAAQLSTIVSAWPAASPAPVLDEPAPHEARSAGA